ncbi:hypothetical protein MJG53_007762 [Ovis ammon polii x Ovis aries]|uniref:Uncharacterized protein n=1 Tax=Ovis ammon polii x Ovis aries TaxID=2918886 RepID=A0ACB9V4A2_9CETA|nr:hypothetical protein MJG53_007762 [Ovis ammon polii x Ovis aries]
MGSLKGAYVSQVGQNADLPCTYSPATNENLVPVCWGKGPCPVFECYRLVLRTDGRNVTYQTSSRYLLKRDLHKGDVTLTIKNVTLADSGTYCCRIQFPGLMNDQKSNLELIIKPETQTLEALHDKNQTEISTLATESQDMGAATRTGLYIGAGVSAGLALILISSGLILKWYSDRKEKIQNSSSTYNNNHHYSNNHHHYSKKNHYKKDSKENHYKKDSKENHYKKDSKENHYKKDSKENHYKKDSKENHYKKDSKENHYKKDSKKNHYKKDSKKNHYKKDSKKNHYKKDSKENHYKKDNYHP